MRPIPSYHLMSTAFKLNHRIIEWLGKEGTSKGHQVQSPKDQPDLEHFQDILGHLQSLGSLFQCFTNTYRVAVFQLNLIFFFFFNLCYCLSRNNMSHNVILLYFRSYFCKKLSITQQQLYSLIDLVRKSFPTFWGTGVLYLLKFFKIQLTALCWQIYLYGKWKYFFSSPHF